MDTVSAKILDPTHLEPSQPLDASPGDVVKISLIRDDEDADVWRNAGKNHLLDACADEDAVYDEL
jgi:hypothetical protein